MRWGAGKSDGLTDSGQSALEGLKIAVCSVNIAADKAEIAMCVVSGSSSAGSSWTR
jgi:hypothetical protein